MGEKEVGSLSGVDASLGKAKEGAPLARQETDTTESEVMFNPKEYTVERSGGGQETAPADPDAAEKSAQWEPHKSPGLDSPEQEGVTVIDSALDDDRDAESKIRHDTVKNSIGNIRQRGRNRTRVVTGDEDPCAASKRSGGGLRQ